MACHDDGICVIADAELRELRDIAGTMIPADDAKGMPGADDPAILAADTAEFPFASTLLAFVFALRL